MPTPVRRLIVLVHFPATFAAIVAAAIILAASAGGGVVFRSSVGTALVRSAIRNETDPAISVATNGVMTADIIAFQEKQLEQAVRPIQGLDSVTTTLLGSDAIVQVPSSAGPDSEPVSHVRLGSRSGFLSHVEVMSRSSGTADGVWLADIVATKLRVTPGETVTITQGARSVDATVAGTYRALAAEPATPFWAPLSQAIYPTGASPSPPTLLLADEPELLRITTGLGDVGSEGWDFDLTADARSTMTLEGAKQLNAAIGDLQFRIGDPTNQLGAALQQPSLRSPIPGIVADSTSAVDSIAGAIGTFGVTGEVVALVGMLAAGVYGIRRRHTEVRMLHAIGLSWVRFGIRTATEAILPVAVGTGVGWLLAERLVGAFGPSPSLEPAAIRASLVSAVAVGVVALVVLGIVAAVAGRIELSETSGGRVRRLLAGALWEVPVLVLAAAAFYEIETRGPAPVQSANSSAQVDQLLLLFPILFIAGAGGLAVRGLSQVFARMRTRNARSPVWLFLAARRLSAAPRIALMLVTASCLAIGVLSYAGTIVSSTRATTFDKAMVSVGADVAALTNGELGAPASGHAPPLTNVIDVSAQVASSHGFANIIAIDPSTFGRVAFWDPRFSSMSLDELVRSVSDSSGSAIPAIVVNGSASDASSLVIAGYPIRLDVVGSAVAFPGEHIGLNVVVSASVLRQTLAVHGVDIGSVGADYQSWARGDTADAIAYFESRGIGPQWIVTAREKLMTPGGRALSWALGFMEVLGVMTALVALIGLVLYLQARQRGREVSYALSHRMGLSAAAHTAAIAVELALILLAALVVGGVLAIAAAALVYRRLDPMPGLPPPAPFSLPMALFGLIVLAIAASACLGALVVQRQTQRADIAKAMRFAA